jgi:hypothetical protein
MKAVAAALAFAVLCSLALPTTSAEAQTVQPGLWRSKSKMQAGGIPGLPAGMDQDGEDETCVTPAEAKDPARAFTQQGDAPGCKQSAKWAGSQLNFEIKCTGAEPSTTKGTFTFDSPTRYRGTMTTTMLGPSITMQIEGQRVGECAR